MASVNKFMEHLSAEMSEEMADNFLNKVEAAKEVFHDEEKAMKRGDGDEESSYGDGGSDSSSSTEVSSTVDGSGKPVGKDGIVEEVMEMKDSLTKQETKNVFMLRLVVMALLLVTTGAVSAAIYLITSGGESEEFETTFEGAASKVLQSFSSILDEMGAIGGLAIASASHTHENSDRWPLVTLPNFHQRGGNVRVMSRALQISIAPKVTYAQLEAWDDYTRNETVNRWIDESFYYQQERGIDIFESDENIRKNWLTNEKVDPVHYYDSTGKIRREDAVTDYYLPTWQISPLLKADPVNENMLRRDKMSWSVNTTNAFGETTAEDVVIADIVLNEKKAVIGAFDSAPPGDHHSPNRKTAMFAALLSMTEGSEVTYKGDPMANMYIPIFDGFNENTKETVGVINALVHWGSYFRRILPENIFGIIVVLDNSCEGSFTYRLDGPDASIVGDGDHHDTKFDEWERAARFTANTIDDGTKYGVELHKRGCFYQVRVYPSQEFHETYNTATPIFVTCALLAVFLFTIAVFLFYDRMVEKRQEIVLEKATESAAVVASLFPKNVRDRLMEAQKENLEIAANKGGAKTFEADTNKAKPSIAPIADLFPNCTVFFADISGFTAWSSTREPGQVFVLLQALYQAFDKIANRRKVFKVETIGDSYMAVTGLPEPQSYHAQLMVRFACECLAKMNEITKELEATLGPDTSDLSMRCGCHSGPVTAGVLMGERARFQLFGDTVNTASRMESTGRRGMIQVSQSTADVLIAAGKEYWLTPREDLVEAKGKGKMKTYWVNPTKKYASTAASTEEESELHTNNSNKMKVVDFMPVNDSLVNWMSDLLLDSIKQVLYARQLAEIKESKKAPRYIPPGGVTCLDEVMDYIKLPAYNPKTANTGDDYQQVEIDPAVVECLKNYVSVIASWYRRNPFHSFDHACHVTMSVSKLLKRVVNPELTKEQQETMQEADDVARFLYAYTYGIKSDPLAILAMLFSALIHDVDHRGCSNAQLCKEEPTLAQQYSEKSVAEQHSLDLAWEILMQDQYEELRKCLFATQEDLMHFRHLIVNVVLATDIFDKELNARRKARWEKAFSGDDYVVGTDMEVCTMSDNKATIVIEHIIQASDVSHTMQHWHIYQKWNRCLYTEMFMAFHAGRLAKDPSDFWYKGEIGFFDNYVIPLAKKLRECGVFGVYSDEYLNYAVQNRDEWAERGAELVEGWNDTLFEVMAKGGNVRTALHEK